MFGYAAHRPAVPPHPRWQAAKEGRAELMIGSHSQDSVEHAVALMARLGMEPGDAPVYFGQLLGMADNLTFTLGHNGYRRAAGGVSPARCG